MRIASCILAAIITLTPIPALAQDWINYFDTEQRFSVNLPGEPTIEDTTIVSLRSGTYPAKIYRADDGASTYLVKVLDYTEAGTVGEVRGSIAWEAWHYRMDAQESGGQVTYDGYTVVDGIQGHQLQITNADQSRTYIGINLLAGRLYVLEARVPEGLPLPMLFQVSLQMLDENGDRLRYSSDRDGQWTPDERETLR
ncbi:MAG: hypothetical protein V3S07_01825 [Micropepsaceae bacterium]